MCLAAFCGLGLGDALAHVTGLWVDSCHSFYSLPESARRRVGCMHRRSQRLGKTIVEMDALCSLDGALVGWCAGWMVWGMTGRSPWCACVRLLDGTFIGTFTGRYVAPVSPRISWETSLRCHHHLESCRGRRVFYRHLISLILSELPSHSGYPTALLRCAHYIRPVNYVVLEILILTVVSAYFVCSCYT